MKSRTVLLVISYLATISAGVAASLFSQYLPPIALELTGAASTSTIGMVGSQGGAAFLLGWAVGAVVMGQIGDRIGRRMSLFYSVLICSVSTVLTAFVPSVLTIVVLRFFGGIGAGSILLMTAVFVAEAWAHDGRAKIMGILANSFPVGLIVSGLIATNINDWRTAYLIGGSTILLAIGVLVFVRESAWWQASENTARERKAARDGLMSSAHRNDLLSGIVLFGSMLVGLWAAFVWMPTWVGTLGIPTEAAHLRSMTHVVLGLGCVAGGFSAGPLAERFGRKTATGIGYVGCALITLLIFVPVHVPGPLLFTLIFVLSVCIGNNQGVLLGYIPELFPTNMRGLATGICFNVGRLVTVATVLMMGLIIRMFGGYDTAILTFGGAYIVGLIALMKARETQGQHLPA